MRLDVADDARVMMGDTRVVQLFENLARNAREHAGDDVTVRIGLLDEGFYVEDGGPGIDLEECSDVLESGFTTLEDGTGFGLAIVTQIAEAHGWTVSVCDGIDGGARFEFRDAEVV